jgi:tetratricopeptide (TPR) repeat protein
MLSTLKKISFITRLLVLDLKGQEIQMEDNQYRNVQQLIENGDFSVAKRECIEWLDYNNKDINVWWLLAQIHAGIGAYTDAELCYKKIVELDPGSYAGYCYLGLSRVYQGLPEAALTPLLRAVTINPGFDLGYDYLGCVFRDLGRYEEAIKSYGEALRINPELISAKLNLGNLFKNIGRLEEAMECYNQILHIDTEHPGALAGKASVLEKQGMFNEAFRCVRGLVDRDEVNQMSATVFADLSTQFYCQDEAISILLRVLDMPGLAPIEIKGLLFSLGRLYDEQGNYQCAFSVYKKANEMMPNTFNAEMFAGQVDANIKYFTRDKLKEFAVANNSSRRPVFIVGMPRSGTSLVEQVLASHPDVYGAGELDDIAELAVKTIFMSKVEHNFPLSLDFCSSESISILAKEYLNHLEKLSPDAKRITDKIPGNYLYLGFIQLLFPHARVIHCERDPVDTCLSCYFQNFETGHVYSSELATLGEVYHYYKKIMGHWDNVLGLPVYKVKYEDMVGNFESIAREIVDFCGIEWDMQCLEFYKSSRLLNTASYNQVRQPVYKRSVHRWKYYAEYLDELFDALEREYI